MKYIQLKVEDKLHKDIKLKSVEACKSMNQYIIDCIARVPIDVQAKRLGKQILGEDYQTNEFIEEVKNRPENQKPFEPEKEQDKLLKKIMKEVEKPETQCYHEGPSDCVDSCKPGTPKTLAGDVVTIEEVEKEMKSVIKCAGADCDGTCKWCKPKTEKYKMCAIKACKKEAVATTGATDDTNYCRPHYDKTTKTPKRKRIKQYNALDNPKAVKELYDNFTPYPKSKSARKSKFKK